jgi:hypothetical protein
MASYSRQYIVYKIDAGNLIPHNHPVFTGDVAFDIPNRAQEIQVDEETNQRSFNSTTEILTAINDYCREETNDQIEIGSFIIVEKFSVNQNIQKVSKSKTKTK